MRVEKGYSVGVLKFGSDKPDDSHDKKAPGLQNLDIHSLLIFYKFNLSWSSAMAV
jgi:hypothetical protein